MAINISLLLLILYFLIVLIIGYIASRKKTKEDYLIAGRKLGPLVVAFTMAASLIGGNTLINYSGFIYSWGFAVLWAVIGFGLGFIITIPMASKLKKISNKYKFHTMSDYFSQRYGLKTGLISTIIIMVWFILALTVQFIAGARIIESISPINYYFAIILMGLIILTYSLMGGFRSVVKTDIFQFLLFGILLLIIAFSFINGFGTNLDFSSFFDIQALGWGKLIAFFIIGICSVFTAPEVWQRIYAGKNQKSVKSGLIISAFLMIITLFSIGILGLVAKANFTDILPEQAAIMGLTQLLPPALIPIGLVLFFAVIMSTIDTTLFILANNFSKDICKNHINNKTNLVKMTRIGLIIFTAISMFIALIYQDILSIALSFLSIGLSFAPIIVGSFYFNLKPKAIRLALIMALIAVLGLLFAGFVSPETSVISLPVSLIFLLIGQKLFR